MAFHNFNPCSREGSDQWLPILFVHSKISIHAPARGATCCMDEFKNKFEFQSTLPRGERRRVSAGKSARNYFNPRSREGSDRIPRRKDKRRLHFNPRSREGSDLFTIRRILITSFQSTLPRGERPLTQSVPTWSAVFQSTLPRGERRGCVGIVLKHNDFNPRSREGSDSAPCAAFAFIAIFQSTLPRGERL